MKIMLNIHDSLMDYPEATLHNAGHLRLFLINDLVNDVAVGENSRGENDLWERETLQDTLSDSLYFRSIKKHSRHPPQ